MKIIAPWGEHVVLDEGINFKVKKLTIRHDRRISLQIHAKRAEKWTILSGEGEAEVMGRKFAVAARDTVSIPMGEPHRLTCVGREPLVVLEAQFGVCDETDIVRLQDDYGRA